MSYVRYRVESHIARITLDHAPANALSLPMVEELLSLLREARLDDNVRAVVHAGDRHAQRNRLCGRELL
ncbi:MAG: hypothetical protein ACOY4O_20535 [Pseudomonadota bacterium]